MGGDVNCHKGKVRQVCLCKLPGLAVSVCFKNKTELTFYRSPTVMTGSESPIPVMWETGRELSASPGHTPGPFTLHDACPV